MCYAENVTNFDTKCNIPAGSHDSNPDVPICHPSWSKCVADHNPTAGVELNETKVKYV